MQSKGKKFHIGDAVVFVEYSGYRRGRDNYRGYVSVPSRKVRWEFDNLAPSPVSHYEDPLVDAAEDAVAFGSYYTGGDRGDDLPEWAPSEREADAIDDATGWARDEDGEHYEVRRTPRGRPLRRTRRNPGKRYTSPAARRARKVLRCASYGRQLTTKKTKVAARGLRACRSRKR